MSRIILVYLFFPLSNPFKKSDFHIQQFSSCTY